MEIIDVIHVLKKYGVLKPLRDISEDWPSCEQVLATDSVNGLSTLNALTSPTRRGFLEVAATTALVVANPLSAMSVPLKLGLGNPVKSFLEVLFFSSYEFHLAAPRRIDDIDSCATFFKDLPGYLMTFALDPEKIKADAKKDGHYSDWELDTTTLNHSGSRASFFGALSEDFGNRPDEPHMKSCAYCQARRLNVVLAKSGEVDVLKPYQDDVSKVIGGLKSLNISELKTYFADQVQKSQGILDHARKLEAESGIKAASTTRLEEYLSHLREAEAYLSSHGQVDLIRDVEAWTGGHLDSMRENLASVNTSIPFLREQISSAVSAGRKISQSTLDEKFTLARKLLGFDNKIKVSNKNIKAELDNAIQSGESFRIWLNRHSKTSFSVNTFTCGEFFSLFSDLKDEDKVVFYEKDSLIVIADMPENGADNTVLRFYSGLTQIHDNFLTVTVNKDGEIIDFTDLYSRDDLSFFIEGTQNSFLDTIAFFLDHLDILGEEERPVVLGFLKQALNKSSRTSSLILEAYSDNPLIEKIYKIIFPDITYEEHGRYTVRDSFEGRRAQDELDSCRKLEMRYASLPDRKSCVFHEPSHDFIIEKLTLPESDKDKDAPSIEYMVSQDMSAATTFIFYHGKTKTGAMLINKAHSDLSSALPDFFRVLSERGINPEELMWIYPTDGERNSLIARIYANLKKAGIKKENVLVEEYSYLVSNTKSRRFILDLDNGLLYINTFTSRAFPFTAIA